MNPYLLHLAKTYEGCRFKAYLCPAGIPTIGFGHTGPDVKMGMVISSERALELLEADTAGALMWATVLSPRLVGLEKAHGAIADFIFNLGPTKYKASTLRRKIDAGCFDEAAEEILKWNRGGGKVLLGLVLRRRDEAALLLRG